MSDQVICHLGTTMLTSDLNKFMRDMNKCTSATEHMVTYAERALLVHSYIRQNGITNALLKLQNYDGFVSTITNSPVIGFESVNSNSVIIALEDIVDVIGGIIKGIIRLFKGIWAMLQNIVSRLVLMFRGLDAQISRLSSILNKRVSIPASKNAVGGDDGESSESDSVDIDIQIISENRLHAILEKHSLNTSYKSNLKYRTASKNEQGVTIGYETKSDNELTAEEKNAASFDQDSINSTIAQYEELIKEIDKEQFSQETLTITTDGKDKAKEMLSLAKEYKVGIKKCGEELKAVGEHVKKSNGDVKGAEEELKKLNNSGDKHGEKKLKDKLLYLKSIAQLYNKYSVYLSKLSGLYYKGCKASINNCATIIRKGTRIA